MVLSASIWVGTVRPAQEETFTYMFRIEGPKGASSVAFTGEFMVDGITKSLPSAATPYEFRCEAATALKGHFQAVHAEQEIRVTAYLPHMKKGKPIAKAKGARIGVELKGESDDATQRVRLVLWSEAAE